MASDFCHLHVHSEYSLLDGLGRTKDLAAEAARLGQPALALTDHGVMHGAIEFFRNCKKHQVKPIIGVEAYMTPLGRSMQDRDPNKDKYRHHLLLLAQNMTGYKNLLKICSDAQLNGYYYKPRIDADYLAAHADGLICTSGCMAAEIPWLLNPEDGRAPQPEKALERLQWYLDVFGRERFFIELQEHSIPALTQINKTLFDWANQHDLQMLVTNDVHYVTAQDAKAHDTLLCVQTSSLVNQPKRMRMSDSGYYLKSLEELRHTFRSLADLPESAFTNSLKIAEMCEVNLEDDSFHLPDLPEQPVEVMPVHFAESKDYPAFLLYLTDLGLRERYGERADSPEVQARKEHELNIINRMGFAIYYLIVWDLCRYAREQNIWWNVRGSGAGSIVAYATGITLIDPLRHNLIFERFLNPGRISMPDFDLDYPDDQRELMIEYTRQRYGDKRVAQIVSFGRMKARAAIRDVGRALDIPLSEVDVLAKHITAIPGKPATITDTLNADHEFFSPELKGQYDSAEHVQELVDFARSLEGVARHSSVHAAAVIITDKDLTEYVPVMRAQGSAITESVTQFEFPVCESIGLLKVDFLGLSTLTVMRRAADWIEKRHGLKFTLENIPMDNSDLFANYPDFPEPTKAYELLARGDVTGVFQVEGSGMRRMLTEMKPTKFEHIVAAISLFRPGPMEYIPTYIARMHGKEDVEFKHPKLETILSETYGIIVYQEQIIQIASELAGYAPGEADLMRRAVSKKKKDELLLHRDKFIKGAAERDIMAEIGGQIFDDIEFFARYGFNKCLPGDIEILDAKSGRLVTLEALYQGTAQVQHTIACDTDTLTLHSQSIIAVLDNGVRPVFRLTTALGRHIEATANHPFYTFDGWQLLEHLQVGDLIATPRRLPQMGDATWPDYQVIVLGHLLAEGNLCHPHSVYYYTQDEEYLHDYINAVEQFENVTCSVKVHKNTYSVYAKRRQRTQEPGVVLWAKKLNIWGKTASEKAIPAPAFELNNEQIALLLSRLWAGDGHLSQQPDGYTQCYYATASKQLARHVQHLLLRLGVVSRLRTVNFPYKEGRIGYQVHVMGGEHIKNFATTVGKHFFKQQYQQLCEAALTTETTTARGVRDIVPLAVKEIVRHNKTAAGITWPQVRAEAEVAQREFYPSSNSGKRGFRRETIARLADYFDSQELFKYADNDIYWDEVVAIEYVGEKQTFDLTIPKFHNFIANDILVHNSHAADYALVTCQTAYLKAHYPIEYMTALLTVERGNTDKVGMLIGECRAMGFEVLPPNVNEGDIEFSILDRADQGSGDQKSAITFSLGAIKNVGEGPVRAIVAARNIDGPFRDLDEFCSRVDLRQVGRRALESLIKVGALDDFAPRYQLLAITDRMMNLSSSTHKAADAGQMSMFDTDIFDAPQTGSVLHPLPDVPPLGQKELLAWEKELAGTYISNHPIQRYMADIKAANTTLLGELDETKQDQLVTVAGLVNFVRHHQTKKGDAMAFVEIEDAQTTCEIVVFPKAFRAFKELLVESKLIVVRGKVDAKGNGAKILADTITTELRIINRPQQDEPRPSQPPSEPKEPLPLFEGSPPPKTPPTNGHPDLPNGYANGGATKPPAKVAEAAATYQAPPQPPAEMSKMIERQTAAGSPQLQVTLPCTGNLATDKHRLRQMFHLLTQYGGKDTFCINILTKERPIQIDFPNHATHFTQELERKLVVLFEAEVRWSE